jgi:uncharacterized repeat protein (TIGR04138 family)
MSGDALAEFARRDGRYPVEAYRYLFEALQYTLTSLNRKGHVTGRELALGIRDKALEDFGGLALMVFTGWNIHRTDDFGEMIWALVEAKLMGRSDEDRKEDFNGVYDFAEAFPLTATPRRKQA